MNSTPNDPIALLSTLADVFRKTQDPRDPQGVRHDFQGRPPNKLPDEHGNPLLMLNVFVHDLKVTLEQWSVHGDKTNEPGSLKKHLEKLFDA